MRLFFVPYQQAPAPLFSSLLGCLRKNHFYRRVAPHSVRMSAPKSHPFVREVYERAQRVTSAVPHPRTLATILECGGKMHMQVHMLPLFLLAHFFYIYVSIGGCITLVRCVSPYQPFILGRIGTRMQALFIVLARWRDYDTRAAFLWCPSYRNSLSYRLPHYSTQLQRTHVVGAFAVGSCHCGCSAPLIPTTCARSPSLRTRLLGCRTTASCGAWFCVSPPLPPAQLPPHTAARSHDVVWRNHIYQWAFLLLWRNAGEGVGPSVHGVFSELQELRRSGRPGAVAGVACGR